MTCVAHRKVRCYCCGTISRQPVLLTGNEFRSRDLDRRPGEMLRSSMRSWLQECPRCRYVSSNLEQGDACDRRHVRSRRYQALTQGPQLSALTHRFLLRTALENAKANHEAAFEQALCAAWTADDLNLPDYARTLRLRAIGYLATGTCLSAELELVRLDVLRRASDWRNAHLIVARLTECSLDAPASTIVRFQANRIAARDNRRYTVTQALESRRPHLPAPT